MGTSGTQLEGEIFGSVSLDYSNIITDLNAYYASATGLRTYVLYLTWSLIPVSEGPLLPPLTRSTEKVKQQQASGTGELQTRIQMTLWSPNSYTQPIPSSRLTVMQHKACDKHSPCERRGEVKRATAEGAGQLPPSDGQRRKKKTRKTRRGELQKTKLRKLNIVISLRKRLYFKEPVI